MSHIFERKKVFWFVAIHTESEKKRDANKTAKHIHSVFT